VMEGEFGKTCPSWCGHVGLKGYAILCEESRGGRRTMGIPWPAVKGFLTLRRPLYKYQVNHILSVSRHERVLLPLVRGWSAVCQLIHRAGAFPRTMIIGQYVTGELEH
jgi:hypothetical protein